VEHHIEILFISRFFLMFVIERFMRVFFDKRRTRFPVAALSYLAFPVGVNGVTTLQLFLGELPVILALILDVAPSVALLYVIALNYEGTWKKRLVAAISIIAIGGRDKCRVLCCIRRLHHLAFRSSAQAERYPFIL